MKPSVLAKNIDVIPAPSMLGICISATEISTFGNPPTATDADCKLSSPNTLENIPVTPSIPWNTARPANAITAIATIERNSLLWTIHCRTLGY